MRLSRDDDKAGESTSIERQRIILKNYVAERGGEIIEEYADDGWSGTSFDRPALKRMLDDAKSGKIDTIIVKDLSRFGRNYIQVGQYVDYIFPAYGIRFIAISDNVDTADRSSTAMDMMPIMNVFNEWHAANTSKKIRAVLDASRCSGKYTSWSYPYGYKASSDENRTARIDDIAAATVRRIFNLRAEGKSARFIAKTLTDEGILNPATYFTRLDGGKWDRACSPHWSPTTVMRILSNPVYIGRTVQRKTTSVSYKNHKCVTVPEDERIIKENAHPPIVSRELWDRVQTVNNSVSRGKAASGRVHALSGLLYCADCGKKMKLKTSRRNPKSDGYACRTYTDLGKGYCSSHGISERELEELVLRDIRALASGVKIDYEKAKARYISEREKSGERSRCSDEKRLKAIDCRLGELDRLLSSAFEERILKDMPEDVFSRLLEKYRAERTDLEGERLSVAQRLESPSVDGAEEFVERLKEYAGLNTLTRDLCLQLINFITVGEKSDGAREIHIYYNALSK